MRGNTASANHDITIDSATTIGATVNGTALSYTVPTVNDGKHREWSLERTGTAVDLILDGVTYVDATAAAGDFILNAIGRTSVGNYFPGVLDDCGYDAGWAGTGYTNPNYPLDDADNVARNSNHPTLGNGVYNNFEVDFSDRELMTLQGNGDWLSNTNLWVLGAYTSTGSEGTFIQVLPASGGGGTIEENTPYFITLNASGFTAGEMRVRNDTDPIIASTNGVHDATFISGSTFLRVRTGASQPNAGATFSDISVKRLLEAP